jgi:hypothetical protein
MKKTVLIPAAVVILIVVVSGIYIGYSGILNDTSTNPTPTPEVPTQETVRDSAITYIAENHADIESLTADLAWTGARQDTGLVGSDTYIYTAGNWNVTITNPVVPDPTYTVSAVYTDAASQVIIEWQGTYQNNEVAETSFDYIVP